MQCSVCNTNEATVHLTQVIGDKLQKIDLCEGCSQEKGVSDTTGFALAELLLGMNEPKDEAPGGGGSKKQLTCPHCGFSQADLKKTARLGCPECYDTFSESLTGLLKNMHRGNRHVGKVPGTPAPAAASAFKLDELNDQLADAVKQEQFERAALLRDEIKALKSKASDLAAS